MSVLLRFLAMLVFSGYVLAAPAVDERPANWRFNLTKPEMMTFERGESIYWHISTNQGDMKFKLFQTVAPMHVTSTIYLTEQGFYDGLIFHRIIPQFMAQGGDPRGNGSGGPGYQYDGEFNPRVTHNRGGLLSMANRGPGTDGSQFFITFIATPWLDNKHTIFGEIVSGGDVLAKMEQLGSRSGHTRGRVVIEKATIERVQP